MLDWPGARRRPASARARPPVQEFNGSLEGVPQQVHAPPPHLDLSSVKNAATTASPPARSPGPPPSASAAPARPTAPRGRGGESSGEVTAVHLANLEEEFRAVLGQLRSVYEGEKEILV